MKTCLQFYVLILVIVLFAKCKSAAKFAIDESYITKTDTGLLGIWKAVEDTDKANYFFVQSAWDGFHAFEEQYKKADKTHPVSDVDYYNALNQYKREKDNVYYVTYMNRHGRNPIYNRWGCFLSNVNNTLFVNIGSLYTNMHRHFFVRMVNISPQHDSITTAVFTDTTLKYLNSSVEIRGRVEKNMYNPTFYSDTLHFYKVSNYHYSLYESVKQAN